MPLKRCGFTLIELLVVTAMMAILTAILMPMVSVANDRTHIAVCESNLRQISLAMRMYAEDYGALPLQLEQLYTSRFVEDPAILMCSKTGAQYWYQRVPFVADRGKIIAACVPYPQTPKGKRPHSLRSATLTLTLGGTVRLRND